MFGEISPNRSRELLCVEPVSSKTSSTSKQRRECHNAKDCSLAGCKLVSAAESHAQAEKKDQQTYKRKYFHGKNVIVTDIADH